MGDNEVVTWVVEVCSADAQSLQDEWVLIAECVDGKTAIAVTDALHNLVLSDVVVGCQLQVRARIAPNPCTGGGRDGD